MTLERTMPKPADVLRALQNSAKHEVNQEQRARLLSRLETSMLTASAAIALGSVVDQVNSGADVTVSLVDRIAAHLAVHPVATVVSTLALGVALGGGTVASTTARHHQNAPPHGTVGQTHVSANPVASLVAEPVVAIEDLPRVAAAPRTAAVDNANRQSASSNAVQQQLAPADSATSGPGPGLAEQLALLETARTALRQHDAAAALRALQEHAAKFPKSLLAEEREALTIRALLMSNRVPEAQSRLARFEQTYPGSLLLPTLRGALDNSK